MPIFPVRGCRRQVLTQTRQNGNSWKEDVQAGINQVPYLINSYKTSRASNYTLALEHGGFDPSSRTFPANIGECIDIVWLNNGGLTGKFDFHPMHIHGEHAWDLGSGNGTYNAIENEKRFDNFTPSPRDTTILYRYMQQGLPHATAGWRAWRICITEDNIGVWIMHCHIAQHAVMGMNTVWTFGDESIRKKFKALPYTQGYLEFGGDAYGNRSYDPSVNHYFKKDNLTRIGPLRKQPPADSGGCTPRTLVSASSPRTVPNAIVYIWAPVRFVLGILRQIDRGGRILGPGTPG